MRNKRWSKYHQTGLIGESWPLTSIEEENQKVRCYDEHHCLSHLEDQHEVLAHIANIQTNLSKKIRAILILLFTKRN
jgi:hypothetical protein